MLILDIACSIFHHKNDFKISICKNSYLFIPYISNLSWEGLLTLSLYEASLPKILLKYNIHMK